LPCFFPNLFHGGLIPHELDKRQINFIGKDHDRISLRLCFFKRVLRIDMDRSESAQECNPMRSGDEILLMIDEAEQASADVFFVYKATYELITSALKWSIGKTAEEIMTRRGKCRYRQKQMKRADMKNNWQLIMDTLSWVLEETEIDPLESLNILMPF
jgi:hypothetical protein